MFAGEATNPFGPEIVIDGSAFGLNVGISINGSDNTVRELVLQGFTTSCITINGDSNLVAGCYIGVAPTGDTCEILNQTGVYIYGDYNRLREEGSGNVIAGNTYRAINLIGCNYNQVAYYLIGLNNTGTDTLYNEGIRIGAVSQYNVIGPGNVISGSNSMGIIMSGEQTRYNVTRGNYIGTDITGTIALGAKADGIYIYDCSQNIIGGPSHIPGNRNVISGNGAAGIALWSDKAKCDSNQIIGNFIGTDVSGMNAVPNRDRGILIDDNVIYTVIGGVEEGMGNLISGNRIYGIHTVVTGVSNTVIEGNYIGTDITGLGAIPNEDGLKISESSHNSIGPSNIIAFNENNGVIIGGAEAVSNTATQNSIHSHGRKGISLQGGSNLNIPAPVITSTSPVAGIAQANATVEIFSGPDNEGMYYEGVVTADASGNFSWNGTPRGECVTATATDADGNTSMFSDSVLVSTTVRRTAAIPEAFYTAQNYPNPFNPETVIPFGISNVCRVTVRVYDMLGHELRTLVDKICEPGFYEVLFDAKDLSSGVYFYRIEAVRERKVVKMLLLE